MIGILLIVACFGTLYFIVRANTSSVSSKLVVLMLAGFVIRIILQSFVREIAFFSHEAGGDSEGYEGLAVSIAQVWRVSGFQFMTDDDIPGMGSATLPCNLFAIVTYLNDGPSRFGCTALIALAACLTCLNIFHLAVMLGAEEESSFRVVAVLLFAPAFLLYTSDTYKDGLVAFFVFGALGSGFRLARRFSVLHLLVGLLSMFALWYVRYYLIFLSSAPLLVGLAGVGSRSTTRPLLAAIVLGAGAIAIASYTNIFNEVSSAAEQTFDLATNENSRTYNSVGAGSGVFFDDGGSQYGALGPKIVYTLFSPFPWQTGSFGLWMGKVDVAIWYYLFYRAFRAARRLWQEDRGLLLTFLTFLIPMTIVYAMTMANIGLILRQRLPIVMVGALLAMQSWPRKITESTADSDTDTEEENERDDMASAQQESSG